MNWKGSAWPYTYAWPRLSECPGKSTRPVGTRNICPRRGVLPSWRKSVVLNAPALEILTTLPRLGAHVIAGADPANRRSDLKRPWTLVCRRAALHGLRLHDLR